MTMRLWNLFLPFLLSPCLAKNYSPPVFVQLYYEAGCPYCKAFIYKDLYSTWAILESTGIIKVAMYPYGKASMTLSSNGMWKFKCQNGESECIENLEHTCIMSRLGWNSDRYLAMITCLHYVGNSCYTTWTDFTYNDIETCAEGIEGNTLGRMMGNLTQCLNPPLKTETVPHILVDGRLYQNDWHNLTAEVCHMYQGSRPEECDYDAEPPFDATIEEIEDGVHCSAENLSVFREIYGAKGSALPDKKIKDDIIEHILCKAFKHTRD